MNQIKNFQLFNESINRCTNVTLEAFGIKVDYPIRGFQEIKKILRNNGYEVSSYVPFLDYIGKPIKYFIETHTEGKYLLGTSMHSMAYIDGVLYDSANGTTRRKLDTAYEVTKRSE